MGTPLLENHMNGKTISPPFFYAFNYAYTKGEGRLRYNKAAIIKDYKSGMSLARLRKKYGISISYAHEILHEAGVTRSVSESLLLHKSHQKEWHKLVRIGSKTSRDKKCKTRLISIPAAILLQLGVDPSRNLIGRWVLQDKKLILEVKEKP